MKRHRRLSIHRFSSASARLLGSASLLLAVWGTSSLVSPAPALGQADVAASDQPKISHRFSYTASSGAEHVYVAGDFNNWSADATPMREHDGVFTADVPLTPGVHHYKFVVDGKWMTDPGANPALQQNDNYGGQNSGVLIDAHAAAAAPDVFPASAAAPTGNQPPRSISTAGETVSHTFRYTPAAADRPRHVFLAGDFNNWSTDATPMREENGSFTVTIPLVRGLHQYKFVVDGHWLADPNDDKSLEVDDNNGGMNSVVQVGRPAVVMPPAPAGVIDAADITFNPGNVEDCNVANDHQLRLSIRAQKHNLTGVAVVIQGQGGDWKTVPLSFADTEGGFDRFGGLVPTDASSVRYVFELHDGPTAAYVADGKAYASVDAAESAAYQVQMQPSFTTPDWAKHAVWYQIFPERFRNGDTANDPRHTLRWTSDWFSPQPGERGNFYSYVYNRRYGGDIQGIEQELPYLRSLGVNAIYLNPVFQAASLHKYDATDYRHIDEHFGYAGDIEQLQGEGEDPSTWQWTRSDKLFLDFVAEAHRQGFHVIIDGVFNHVGRPFWAFQDVVKNGRNSKYAGWFDITDWNPGTDKDGNPIPFHYKAWDGDNGSLPIFKKDAKIGIVHGPREHILAIARRWLAPDGDPSRGVDGFRLDAPENVPHPFWVDFRKTVKATKPDAYIDGEIWSWAQPWLSGDQFDAVMNYQFAIPTQAFFVDQRKALSVSKYNEDLNAVIFNYPQQVALVNQNLLDSHDTDRAASMFMNPDLGFNASARLQDNNPQYNPHKPSDVDRQRMLQEVVVQMTFLGAPMIYYGDEAGMFGAADPSDRMPMIWKDLGTYDNPDERFDQGKFDWYQRLIALRRQFPAMQTGFFRPLEMKDADGVYAYERTAPGQEPGQSVYVVINRSRSAHEVSVPIDRADAAQHLVDWLEPSQAQVRFSAAQAADARPAINPAPDATGISVRDGRVLLKLRPWGSAVLSAETSPAQ